MVEGSRELSLAHLALACASTARCPRIFWPSLDSYDGALILLDLYPLPTDAGHYSSPPTQWEFMQFLGGVAGVVRDVVQLGAVHP